MSNLSVSNYGGLCQELVKKKKKRSCHDWQSIWNIVYGILFLPPTNIISFINCGSETLNKQSKITQPKVVKAAEPGSVPALAGRHCLLQKLEWASRGRNPVPRPRGPSSRAIQALEESVPWAKPSSEVWERGRDSGPLSQLGQPSPRGQSLPPRVGSSHPSPEPTSPLPSPSRISSRRPPESA